MHERWDTGALWVQCTAMLAREGPGVCSVWIGSAGKTAVNENDRSLRENQGMIQKRAGQEHAHDGNHV
jgi:hypothetical protein